MLTKVEVYSSSQLTSSLTFDDSVPIETDFVQVLNIVGLDPVKASIDVISSGNVDGAVGMDSSVPTRNIVMTLRPNPDWNTWTAEQLRQFIYNYFIPKSTVRLYFTSDEISSEVMIEGIVESCDANPFTKDPSYDVSIVCPDPYFVAVDPVVVTGSVINPSGFDSSKTVVTHPGNVPIGVELKMTSGYDTELYVQLGNPAVGTFLMIGSVTGIFYLGSIPTKKYVRSANTTNGTFLNRLNELQLGSIWPVLNPGDNDFAVMSAYSVGNPWELTFYPKYGGL